jgi:hypothetical protein
MRIHEIITEDFDGTGDLSDPKYSQTKSIDPNGELLAILTAKREDLLFHHSDPQMPVSEFLATNPTISFAQLDGAIKSGALDAVVEKLSTSSTNGENVIIFKGDDIDLPDSTGGSTGGAGKDPAKVVSSMAKRAAGA